MRREERPRTVSEARLPYNTVQWGLWAAVLYPAVGGCRTIQWGLPDSTVGAAILYSGGCHTIQWGLWAAVLYNTVGAAVLYPAVGCRAVQYSGGCGLPYRSLWGVVDMASMDAEFLREKVGARLAKAVAAASASGVSDKIDYIADWLLQQVRCH